MKILTLQKRIMWRVYLLYFVRKLKTPFVPELIVICGLSIALSFLVSFPSVFSNVLLTHGSYHFLTDAFLKAGMTVKLILLSTVIVTLFFLHDLGLYTNNLIRTNLA